MNPIPRWLMGVGVVLAIVVALGIAFGGKITNRWQADVKTWKDSATVFRDRLAASDSAWRNVHQPKLLQFEATFDSMADRLKTVTAQANVQAAIAAQLRRERAALVVTSSVPGQAPTIGDTLATCRMGLSLCEQEAAAEKTRADSLDQAANFFLVQMNSAREDAMGFRQSWEMDRRLLVRSDSLLRSATALLDAADPPCYMWRAGFIRIHCLGRKDGAALAAAGTLLVASQFAESKDAAKGMKIAAGVLVVGSVIIW